MLLYFGNDESDIENYVHIWLLPTEYHYYKNKRKGNRANNTAILPPTTYC
jgi:hypothetical protein